MSTASILADNPKSGSAVSSLSVARFTVLTLVDAHSETSPDSGKGSDSDFRQSHCPIASPMSQARFRNSYLGLPCLYY